MITKKELIERLHKNPLYKMALASVDPQQSQRIAMITEGFLGRALDGFVPLINNVSDPEVAIQIKESISTLSGSNL